MMLPGRSPQGIPWWVLPALVLALQAGPAAAQNIVIVIADDVGAEWFDSYGEQAGNPPTPTIQALANQGVLFRNAWAYPVCSPFRISAYTGRHPYEHGSGHAIANDPDLDYVLDPYAPNLANILASAGYRTAAAGKWHMATHLGYDSPDIWDAKVDATEGHPNFSGIQDYSGFLFGGLLYWQWLKTVNGKMAWSYDYATTDTADAAIARLSGAEPFFLWVGFNAPHGVFHHPPPALLANPSIYPNNGLGQYKGMIEALDTEIGRFLSFVDWSDTTVLFVADNGAPGAFLQAPRSIHHGKGTVYEPGVRVPLIVAGQAVAQAARGGETAALVQATDIFPTVLELAGHPPQPRLDAVSMAPYLSNPATPPQRETVYTEIFTPNGGPIDPASYHRAARDARYKLVRRGFLPDELYDLELDPYEASPLDLAGLSTAERQAYQRLVRAISPTALSPAVPSVPHAVIPGLAVALLAVAWRLRPGRPRAW